MKEKTKVIDYTNGCWGHSFYIDDEKTKTAHGFYSGLNFETINNGDLVFIYDTTNKTGAWIARVKKVENCRDPEDMFFCKYKTLKGFDDLHKEEKRTVEKLFNRYQ